MANIADITWSNVGMTFSEAERQAAVSVLPPGDAYVRTIPPTAPVISDGQNTGAVDPEQMMADGFIYVGGRWVRSSNGAISGVLETIETGGGGSARPGVASVGTAQTTGGVVLGVTVPTAPPVLLPSFVGGRIGHVVRSGGLRPESGGTPRVVKGYGERPRWARVVR